MLLLLSMARRAPQKELLLREPLFVGAGTGAAQLDIIGTSFGRHLTEAALVNRDSIKFAACADSRYELKSHRIL